MGNSIGIGSEYYLDLNQLCVKKDTIFEYLKEYETYYFHTGREAISFIYNNQSKKSNKRKVLLPEFVCESVINSFPNDLVSFYKVGINLKLSIEDIINRIESENSIGFLYVIHYFGTVQDYEMLKQLKILCTKKRITIIEDTTHSIFSKKSTIGDYMVSSLRKWFPIPHGAVLYTNKRIDGYDLLPKSNSNDRSIGHLMKWIALETDKDLSREYRMIFTDEEQKIDNNENIYAISDFSKFLLSCFSVSEIVKKRKSNYKFLFEHLKFNPINQITSNDCPFTFCLFIDERDRFRQFLNENGIYCAVHWPHYSFKDDERNNSLQISNRIISIPIDQRYSIIDMKHIVETINKYGGENA